MPWQRLVADVAGELQPDGTLYYNRVVVTVPRQAGKTTLVLSEITHRSIADFPGGRLDVGPQPQTVVYTAQTRNDARKKWIKEFVPLLEKSPFHTQFDKRLTNGSEGLDWVNKSTFDLIATTEKSGHGDVLDLGVIDEAFAQIDDRVEQAMEPATVTRVSSQIWIVSTAGDNPLKSPFLWSEVEAGRAAVTDPNSRTAYFEWSCGPDDDVEDIKVIASRHPAVGHTITIDDLAAAKSKAEKTHKLAGFYRAYCNMWGTVAERKPVKLPVDKWQSTHTDEIVDIQPGELAIAYDVSKDGEWAAIGLAAGHLSGPYVELIDHRPGTDWLAERLVQLVAKWDPLKVGCNGAGPAGAAVGKILMAFSEAGIPMDTLHQMGAAEYKQACGGFYLDVIEGRLRHRQQGPLDEAALDATDRSLGDAWVWDVRNSTKPIPGLVAVTIARALLPVDLNSPNQGPLFAFS